MEEKKADFGVSLQSEVSKQKIIVDQQVAGATTHLGESNQSGRGFAFNPHSTPDYLNNLLYPQIPFKTQIISEDERLGLEEPGHQKEKVNFVIV